MVAVPRALLDLTVLIYQERGGRIPFFLSVVDCLGKQREFLQESLCFNHAVVHYIGKNFFVQVTEDLI